MNERHTIQRRPFSRRRFLQTSGVVVGLPYLASHLERDAQAAVECQAAQRFIAVFCPCGMHMPDFTPTTAGAQWEMPYILEPLAPLRNKIAVISGVDYHQTGMPGEPPGGHGAGTGSFLTMMPVFNNDNNPNRISIDQKIAQETAACNRPLPSLQLGLTVRGDGNDRVPRLGHLQSISWAGNNPLSFVDDPRRNFARLFAGTDFDATNIEAQRRRAIRNSVLDYVVDQIGALNMTLAPADRAKLDQYLTSVRSLETRIENSGAVACSRPQSPGVDGSIPYQDRVPLTLELAAIAFECDLTRVATFMFGRGGSLQDFEFLVGRSSQHHFTSHHRRDAQLLSELREIDRWEVQQFSNFIQRLDQTVEANGKTILDNTLAYFGSEISDGDSHRMYDMPIVLAGSAGGRLKVDGTHYQYSQMEFPRPTLVRPRGGEPHGINLFVSFMRAFGLPDDTFGDRSASGPLEDLLV